MLLIFSICTVAVAGCGALLGFPAPSDLDLTFNVAGPGEPLSADGDAVFDEQSIFEEIPGKTGCHAATVTALPDGELLAAWYAYTGPHELDGAAIYMARRLPHADRWEPPTLHIDRPQGDGNPVLYSEGEQVWLFQAVVWGGWSTSAIATQTSSDGGRSWSAPRLIPGPIGSNTRFPPVRTAAGTLLLPAYDDLWSRALFFSSTDGENWRWISAVYCDPPLNCIQPSVARLGDGRLLAVMRNKGRQWLWVMASDDHGASWSRPMDSGAPNPDSATALLSLAGGRLALVYNDSPTERKRLSIALSGDDGRTWPHQRVVADGESTYSYPSAVQAPDGMIHVVYSLGRETIRHVTLNEAWIVATR